MPSQELQQVMSAVQQELKSTQDASLGSAHEVSAVLQTLLKEGTLSTNIPKISAFSGEMAKGEVSFEQWSYELQTLRKSYSNSALREGIQHSLRGSAADAVHNMGPNVPLDMILKKFTIIYGNVKSFDLLMREFYRADQGEDETIHPSLLGYRDSCPKFGTGSPTSFPTRRNRGSSRTACFTGVERASGTVSSTVLQMPVWTICNS